MARQNPQEPKAPQLSKPKYERDYKPPTFTIKEIRDSIPAHLFERNGWLATAYLCKDLAMAFSLFFLASYIDSPFLPSYLRYIAWPAYWFAQGVVLTGIWVVAHECGHQAYSNVKAVNNTVGFILHSLLLVPYHSWRFSHSAHHKATGHMTRDQVFVPRSRSEKGYPPADNDHNISVSHLVGESPLMSLVCIVGMLLLGWPLYLFSNVSGQRYSGWASHFNAHSPFFLADQRLDVHLSTLGVLVVGGGLTYLAKMLSFATIFKFYVVPYLFVNLWLTLITFLQHTDPVLPHYREKEWNFQRGALCTVDRSFGPLNSMFHHITDSHVAHHFFSTMPYWNALKATPYLKAKLGEYYIRDDTPFPIALWRNWRACQFVEDTGDVLFYKN